MAHFIEHMLFKGTKTRSAYEIAKAFDAIGGHTNAFTSMENTCYHAKAIDTHLEKMSDILSDIFLNANSYIPIFLKSNALSIDTPTTAKRFL